MSLRRYAISVPDALGPIQALKLWLEADDKEHGWYVSTHVWRALLGLSQDRLSLSGMSTRSLSPALARRARSIAAPMSSSASTALWLPSARAPRLTPTGSH